MDVNVASIRKIKYVQWRLQYNIYGDSLHSSSITDGLYQDILYILVLADKGWMIILQTVYTDLFSITLLGKLVDGITLYDKALIDYLSYRLFDYIYLLFRIKVRVSKTSFKSLNVDEGIITD